MMSSCDRWNTELRLTFYKDHSFQREQCWPTGRCEQTEHPAPPCPGGASVQLYTTSVHRTCLSSWTTFPSDNCTVGDGAVHAVCDTINGHGAWLNPRLVKLMTAIETSAFLALHQGPIPHCWLQNGFIKSDKSPPSLHRQHRAGSAPGISRYTVMSNIFGEHKMFLYSKYFWYL